MNPLREKCRTCPRSLTEQDLLAGLCPTCLLARTEDFVKRFGPSFNGGAPRCFECNKPIGEGGYLHWDSVANSFALLCIPCSTVAIEKDGQYRGTEFAFAQKVQ